MNEKVIYSKFSNDRAEQFAIRTDIVKRQDGSRIIRKSPVKEAACGHIRNMKRWEQELLAMYQETRLQINVCEPDGDSVCFEYVEGPTLDEQIQKLLTEQKNQEAAELLEEYLNLVYSQNSRQPFQMTEGFRDVFGNVETCGNWRCGNVSNVDMIMENILLGKEWTMIDYEWTFDFPVPVSFLIFRILFYFGVKGSKEKKLVDSFYGKFGISEEEKETFRVMEEHYQSFLVKGHEPLHRLYGSMGQEIYQVRTLLHEQEVSRQQQKLQVFFDRGAGFSEKDSVFLFQEGKQKTYRIQLQPGVKTVRIDPAASACQITIREFRVEDGICISHYETNGYRCSENSILFDTEDPQILIGELPDQADCILLTFTLELISCDEAAARMEIFRKKDHQMAEMEAQYQEAIRQRDAANAQLQSLMNSTSWKLTAPMRAAGNFRASDLRKKKHDSGCWGCFVIHGAGAKVCKIQETINSLPAGSRMLLYLGASDAVPALKVKGSVRKHLEILKEKPGRSYGASLYTKLQETEAGYFWMVKVGSTWDSQAGEPAGYLGEDTGFLYGDSRINGSPCHKPEYNPEYLHGFNYIGSSWAVRKDLYLSFTGDCPSYAFWNYRMILFLTGNIDLQQHTNPDRIRRIPQILFEEHQAQKKEIWEQELQALKEEFAARSCPAKVKRGSAYGTFRISYPLAETPLVSIIIPNMNHKEDLKRCLDSIREKSTYQNYEILIVENNSSDPEIFAYYEELKQQADIRILIWKGEFNYSAINNFGVSRAKGQYYLLLNNDVEVITPDWIQEMLMYVQQSENGAAGAMLYYPNETVQHGGVILGIGGVAGHSQKNYPRGNTGYYNRLCVPQDLTAVTAACILVRKDVYEEVQGLDEEYKVAFNDVDFCMKIRKSGYRIVFTPYAELYHYESISRGVEDTPQKVQRFGSEVIRFQTKWSRELAQGDPYYNPNLSLEKDDFSLA